MIDFTQKLRRYRRKVEYEWFQYRNARAAKDRERSFNTWLRELLVNPPDVLVGANFAEYGGVRHHIQAIQRFSSEKIALVPDESVIQNVGVYHVVNDFSECFSNYHAPGVKVVHSHVFPWFIKWCRERQKEGIRWVHTYHNHYFPEFGPNGKLETWQQEINNALIDIARYADVRLSVSQWQADMLLREYGIETLYLPNGVDVEMCDRADASRFVNKTGLREFVLYVGRNDPVKNPKEFVQLATRMPTHEFAMIGGELSEETLRKHWNVDVPENLQVLGSLEHSVVLDAIAACAVLVVTSKREGLPTIVMEAMAQQKSIVVPNEWGCKEVIGHGKTGFIYEPGNLGDLVEKTLQAKRHKASGLEARKRVLEHYDWRVLSRKLDSLYGVN